MTTGTVILRGVVESGRREAAGFIRIPWVAERLGELLGRPPYPGTLNLRLREPGALRAWRELASTPGLPIEAREADFCAAAYFPVRLGGGVAAGIVLPYVEGYPADVVELVAARNLRETLGLHDGAEVVLEVVVSGADGSGGPGAATPAAEVKDRHLDVCLTHPVESAHANGFEVFVLEGDLPDFAFAAIDTRTTLFDRLLELPLFISSMTGGSPRAGRINQRLAVAARELGIGMAVGSQRLMLDDPTLSDSFAVRRWAPDILLFADLGLVHLHHRSARERCLRAVESIGADALVLYINPLHEVLQPAGDVDFGGLLGRLAELCADFPYPVIVKEVGFGLPPATLRRLAALPLAGVDVAGRGGTNWARVEAALAGRPLAPCVEELGVATAESLRAAVEILPRTMRVLASGGIRNGVEVAKALALGAAAAGMGLPFLHWADESAERVIAGVRNIERELRLAMWFAGARDLAALRGRIRRLFPPPAGS